MFLAEILVDSLTVYGEFMFTLRVKLRIEMSPWLSSSPALRWWREGGREGGGDWCGAGQISTMNDSHVGSS